MSKRKHNFFFVVIIIGISVVITLLSLEILARINGIHPWRYRGDKNIPIVLENDRELGWKNKAGIYQIPPFSQDTPPIHMTINANGTRKTEDKIARNIDNRPHVAFLGGSFTQGWAISDEQTFPWAIQKKWPNLKIDNYGTAAYGTYQSLLICEKLLSSHKKPALIIYCFFDHHELRNIASSDWLELLAMSSRGFSNNILSVPYVTIKEDGNLLRHRGATYPVWPLRENLAIVKFCEKKFMEITTATRYNQKREVTEKLLLEMRNSCKNGNIPFVFVNLFSSPKTEQHYKQYSSDVGISYVNCTFTWGNQFRVKGEGHPNELANTKWAQCISQTVSDYFSHKRMQPF